MTLDKSRFLFLNLGHFLDHLFMLIFASVAALRLTQEWGLSYAELIPYATPGFVAFGLGAVAAGWIADKWNREGMITIFFIGIGVSSIIAGMANTPFQISISLTLIGLFGAIYHPVGLSMVVIGYEKTGLPLAINGVFGNLGVACAALLTGYLIDTAGWRSAFYVPGFVSIALGIGYFMFNRITQFSPTAVAKSKTAIPTSKQILIRVFAVIFFTTALGGVIFQSTTFALPKIFDERLFGLAVSATEVGLWTFLVFALAALAQLLVGYLIDRFSVRMVFGIVAAMQAVFFTLMTQVDGFLALLVAFGFMFVVFGQIPINDVLVGRMARSEWKSRAFAFRYLVTFSVMASAIPLIGWVHQHWGFDRLFQILAVTSAFIFLAVLTLPRGLGRQ
jgi:MFS family permease